MASCRIPRSPLFPGHEIVGRVEAVGRDVTTLVPGTRIGIPWLGWSCGTCDYCRADRENLCPNARYTGYQINGGYAEYAVADASFCFPLPDKYDDVHAAPLLCAGLIGYRAYRMAGPGARLGIYGFGAAAHIIAQVAVQQGRDVFAFVTPGDHQALQFSRDIGATWAGFSNEPPPRPLDSAIIFAPVGPLVPEALSRVVPGGVVVCAGIHMSDIPSFPYRLLVGRAGDPFGRQPDTPGRTRVPRALRDDGVDDARSRVPADGRKPGARRPARRPPLRCGRSRAVERDSSTRGLEQQGSLRRSVLGRGRPATWRAGSWGEQSDQTRVKAIRRICARLEGWRMPCHLSPGRPASTSAPRTRRNGSARC